MNFKNILATALAFFAISVSAQVSFTYQVTPATCSSNGSIQITATGGTGTLNYQLTSPCLALPLLQQSPVFNNLAPCEYTMTVTDGGTGASATQTAQVGGNYSSPNLSLFCGTCSIEAQATGGLTPLTFAISSNGLAGPYVNNVPANNPVFDNILSLTNYWIKVTDACGNVSVETCQTSEGTLTGFTHEVGLDGNLRVLTVAGGNGPLEYVLQNSNGSFSNATGVWPPIEWGCNMSITVHDGCSSFTKPITVRPKVLSICSNFTAGTAMLGNAVSGIPPYIFKYTSPAGAIISSTTGALTGLPINANFYLFQVVDACGNASDAIFKQKKYPVFKQDPVSCTENSISLYTPNGGCSGGFDADSWPFFVTCLTCSPIESGQVDTSGVSITFNGNTPGNWEFAVDDGCEDQMVCRDSVILIIETFCDSIQATLIDRFICDNGAISDRPMSTGNGIFNLYDANGNLLGSNNTGKYIGLDSGTYKIVLTIPNCSQYEATADIGYWQPVNPVMSTYIYNAVIAGSCRTVYQLVIDPFQGPFTLTGGPNNINLLLDENDLTSSCQYYSVTGLLPGEYQLAETDHCGVKNIHLPAPDHHLEAIPFGNCPGSGTITVSGAQSLIEWKDWGAANNAIINWPSTITDNYSLDVPSNGALTDQTGSSFTFVNVDAGEHTVYLYTLNGQCAIDTVTVNVPEAEVLDFEVSSGIICDGSNTTALHFEVLSGKPPYVIEQVDCNNPNLVLATYDVPDTTLSLPNFTIGDYCFRLIDSCVTSLDHQFSVQYFQDDIELEFNCDNTLTLKVDSINASYTWLDDTGNMLGNSHKINLPNPNVDMEATVLVDLGTCVISRSVTIPATEIIPSLTITGNPYFCQKDTVTLTANSAATSFLWSNGAQTPTVSTSSQGLYTVTVTNGFGCTATADFQLTLDVPVAEIQILSGGSGFGLACFQDSNGVLLANPLVGFAPFGFVWSTQDTTPMVSNLKTGDFTVTMTDAIGCKDTVSVLLTEPDLFVPAVEFFSPRCFGMDDGYLAISGWSGGAGGVTARLLGALPQQVPILFDHLPAGDYFVKISDANGCTVDTSFYFDAPEPLFLDLGEDLTLELGDSVFIEPQVSFAPVDSFLWSTNDPRPLTEFALWLRPIESSYYNLTVWDENGCPVDDKLNIRVTKEAVVYAPNAFSPNNDGVNDLFTLYAKASAVRTIRSFQIFDRFGELVFRQEGFNPNDEPMGWNGRLDGQPMNTAVFVWKADIEFVDGRVEQLYGDVLLMR